MAEQTPALILLAPFFTALIVSLLGLRWPRRCFYPVVLALGISVAAAVATLVRVIRHGEILYFVGGWPRPLGIEYRIDSLNALVLLVIAVAALLAALYSRPVVATETPGKEPQFYTLFLLLVSGLVGISLTGDAFNLYVLLEVTSLTSYALIALGNRRAAMAAFKYVIMGTIGASFYLLGVGYLYIKTGTLNMVDIRDVLVQQHLLGAKSIWVAFVLILIGVSIKMAFFPLHSWLPHAYAFAPSATSCLMAPLVTKVTVYIMIRMMLTVFGVQLAFEQLDWGPMIVWWAVIAMVAGSILALAQTDFKKLIAYVIVIEVAYMVGGIWVGSPLGLAGAFYHVVGDAFMTLCLFVAAGILLRTAPTSQLTSLQGAFRAMPLSMSAFTVGALSVIGIPPTCGFFSKWYLIRAGMETGHWEYVAGLLLSSLLLAILVFRILEIAYFGAEPKAAAHGTSTHASALEPDKRQEGPALMVLPLVSTAVLIVVIGLYNKELIQFILRSIPQFGRAGGLG